MWIIEGYLISVWVKVPSHYFNITIAYYQQKYETSLFDHAVQPVVLNPQNKKIIHNLATHIAQKYYYTIGFWDPNVRACDSKMGCDVPVENHCCSWCVLHTSRMLRGHSKIMCLNKGLSEKVSREKFAKFLKLNIFFNHKGEEMGQ